MGPENDSLDDEWKALAKRMNEGFDENSPRLAGPRDWTAAVPSIDDELSDVDEILNATYDAQEPREKSPGEVAVIAGIALTLLALIGHAFSLVHLSAVAIIVCIVVAIGLGALWFALYGTAADDDWDDGIRL